MKNRKTRKIFAKKNMQQIKTIKFTVLFSLLTGVIFLGTALFFFPKYQSSFSAVILEKKAISRDLNNENNFQEIEHALQLSKYFLLSDTFIEKIEENIDLDFNSSSTYKDFLDEKEEKVFFGQKFKIDKADWIRSISVKRNKEINLIAVKIKSDNPKIVYLYSLEIARSFRESFPEFLNSENLEIKILDNPSKASTNRLDFFYFSLLGVIFGGLIGNIILLVFKKRMENSFLQKKKKREKVGVKKEKREKEKRGKKKKKYIEEELFPKEKNKNLSEDQIKERLNRLINGDL
jgi:capsular polysaccharide biosynthesis protein